MKNFTNSFKQFTSRLSARWLIMALMLLLGIGSAWGAKTTLKQGETITFIFSQGDVPQNYGWNSTQLHIWDDSGNDKTFDFNGQHVLVAGDWIPTKFQFLSKYDHSGWKGQTSDIGDCGGKAKLQPNTTYSVKLAGKDETDWIGSQWNTGSPNKQFKITLHCFADCTPTVTDQIIIKCKSSEKYVYAWVWDSDQKKYNGSTWPGNEITTTEDGYLVLKITTEKDLNVIFSDGQGNQTTDITGLKVGKEYTYNYNDKTYELTGLGCITPSCFTINDLDITASKTSICDGESVTLTLNNKQSGVTYKIGNTTIFNSNVAKPTYNTGAITGVSKKSYTIDATATDQCEAETKTIEITVNSIPATPTFDPAPSYCAGDEITLPIKDKAGNSVTWYKQDGSAAGTPINTAGPHTYKAKATNTSGCVSTDFGTYSYTVKPIPVAGDFSLTGVPQGGFTYNKGTQVPVIETSLQGIGTITPIYYLGNNKVNNPTDAGTYTVKITVSAGTTYCAMSETQIGTFTINKVNQTTPTITANSTNICGKEATFDVSGGESTGNYSYTLDKNDANATREGTTLKATQSGSVTLKVKKLGDTNYNDSEEAVKEFNFTMPIENVTLSKVEDDKTTYCVGDKVEFKLNYNGPYPANYAWSGSAMGSLEATGKTAKVLDNGASWYIDFTEAKTYTIALSLTGCNTQSSNELSFTVNALPGKPTFDAIPAQCSSYTLPKEDKYQVSVNWYNANSNKITTVTQSGTYYAEAVNANNCTSTQRTAVEIIIDKTPTISGETFTQPGRQNKIELTVPDGITAKWSVSPEADLSVSEGNSTMFSAEKNGRYTITATNGTCSDTHVVTVADAFYVYFRAPKEGEETTQSKDAWYQFYYPNENSEQYRGGAMYYGESDAMPTSATLQNFNKGGKTAEIIFTDCDDYTWYGFKASAEVIAGTKYFYVHATNDKGLNGCHTHTKPQKLALTGDIYYTLGDNGSCYDGWAVNKVSAPYAGPKVHASGSTALGTNKFAALYVTDCSGKKVSSYQWEYRRTQAGTYDNYKASVSNSGTLYSGDAGETNNIRPETLGYYRCKVTYEDGSTATSEPVQVTGTYTHASSTLPVIIVNTNGVGFPVNNTCQTPSAHADDMKEKVSVDVKIYDGSTMVYDRKARMNYRGSSSLNFLKKSYAFCPGKDNCVEDKGRLDYVKTEKMNMLGIGEASDKDWVLYAAAADPSLMRNRLMFDTFRDMTGGWSVSSRYVELYVDGVYKGVYVMMDKITNNKKRVNITASNGFIVKFDKTDLADRYEADGDKKTFKSLYSGYDGESGNGVGTYDTFIDQRFEIEYPEMEDVEEDNPGMWAKTVNDIKTLFNNFESNLKAGNYAEVQKIIDYISWADWFIISEYAKNMDAYRASCLFVYNGGKIEARPLWDQELSFNNQCANLCSTYGCNSTTGLLIENSKIYEEGCAAPFWFTGKYVGGRGTEAKSGAQFEGYLLNDPCFIAVLKERWALHTATGGALTQDVMNAKISGYEKDLGSVGTSGTPLYRERNTYWSGKSRKTIDKANSGGTCFTGETGYQDTEISTSISAMKNWITGNRRTNLGTLITNMKGSPLSISFEPQQVTTTPWEPITLQVINTSSYDYTITYTDGELDKQSGVIINKTDDTFKINVPRPDKWGIGDEEVEGERADITYGIKATLNVADGTTVCGKSEVTPATATIILKDEDNEDCD